MMEVHLGEFATSEPPLRGPRRDRNPMLIISGKSSLTSLTVPLIDLGESNDSSSAM
jgi:hypothetical protein